MLRESCPSKASGQERGLCGGGVWGGVEAHPPAGRPVQATVQKAFGKIGDFSGVGDPLDFHVVDEAGE